VWIVGFGGDGSKFFGKFGRDALVRIKTKNPGLCGKAVGVIPMPAFDIHGALEDLGAKRPGDLGRAVSRHVIEDHDLGRERGALETFGKTFLLVFCDHDYGYSGFIHDFYFL
jgi:hypothetical protein